jgi:serine/threonine protein kinase
LKPANVKITPDNKVKVLDFGLAKMYETRPGSAEFSQSPTLVSGTMSGTLIGTAAYMSPEQARGQNADRQSDVWGFGCILYEMLTGKPSFEGSTVADILAAVMKTEPDWNYCRPACLCVFCFC